MSFTNLAKFLGRFQSLRAPQKNLRRALSGVLLECLRLRVAPEHIAIQDETAFVKASSFAKKELRVRKHEVIALLERETGTRLRDIR